MVLVETTLTVSNTVQLIVSTSVWRMQGLYSVFPTINPGILVSFSGHQISLHCSCAFNTIQLMLQRDKFTAWIMDYLINRPQYVRIQDCESDMVCSTGVPQGTLLAPFLFILYSADSAIVDLITDRDGREYRELAQGFVHYWQWSCLQINAGKTKELVVDLRRYKHLLLQGS